MKKYSSVTTIAFTVEHDHETEPTAEEYWEGFHKRYLDIRSIGDEIIEATGHELIDTQENQA